MKGRRGLKWDKETAIGLEYRRSRKATVDSNPTLSAKNVDKSWFFGLLENRDFYSLTVVANRMQIFS
jgi:hypothetical protein